VDEQVERPDPCRSVVDVAMKRHGGADVQFANQRVQLRWVLWIDGWIARAEHAEGRLRLLRQHLRNGLQQQLHPLVAL